MRTKFKVGDRVFLIDGSGLVFGTIIDVHNHELDEYPVVVKYDDDSIESYTSNGAAYAGDEPALSLVKNALNIIYPVMGLNEEVGEVAEKVKKIIRDKGGVLSEEDRQALKKKLGDVLWYVSVLSNSLGFELSEIAQTNIEKLRSRQEKNKINGNERMAQSK